MREPTRTLGGLVRILRASRGLSQHELSDRLRNIERMSQSEISRIETDLRLPDAGQLEGRLRAREASEPDARNARELALDAVSTRWPR